MSCAIASLHALDNLTLLKIWCETTAGTIFRTRKIGSLKQGYEANFIVLGGNPLEKFAHVQDVQARVKGGRVLTVGAAMAK